MTTQKLRPPDFGIDSFFKVPNILVVDSNIIQIGPSDSIWTDSWKFDSWNKFPGFALDSERTLNICYVLVEEIACIVSLN